MADTTEVRPWYKVRRYVGGAITAAGGFLVVAGKIATMVPTQHVVIKVGGVPVTTQMIGVVADQVGTGLAWVGSAIFTWGLGVKQERDKKEEITLCHHK
jgi:hypothetical protein